MPAVLLLVGVYHSIPDGIDRKTLIEAVRQNREPSVCSWTAGPYWLGQRSRWNRLAQAQKRQTPTHAWTPSDDRMEFRLCAAVG